MESPATQRMPTPWRAAVWGLVGVAPCFLAEGGGPWMPLGATWVGGSSLLNSVNLANHLILGALVWSFVAWGKEYLLLRFVMSAARPDSKRVSVHSWANTRVCGHEKRISSILPKQQRRDKGFPEKEPTLQDGLVGRGFKEETFWAKWGGGWDPVM